MDIKMDSGSSIDHGVTDINTDPRHSKITDLDTALNCITGQTSLTWMWPLGAALSRPIIMVSGCNTDHGHTYDLQW